MQYPFTKRLSLDFRREGCVVCLIIVLELTGGVGGGAGLRRKTEVRKPNLNFRFFILKLLLRFS